MRHLARLGAVAVVLAVVLCGGAIAQARPVVLHVRLHRLPDGLTAVSGRFVLLAPTGPRAKGFVVVDNGTAERAKVRPPRSCHLWDHLFGAPWLVFSCDRPMFGSRYAGLALYNIRTRSWRSFPCGWACANTGVAAPDGIGSHWLAMNEDAYCDIRYSRCNQGVVYVSLPTGVTRRYRPSSGTIVDLNSRLLARTLCSPLHGVLALYGNFGVAEDTTGSYLERCGSRLHKRLPSSPETGNSRALIFWPAQSELTGILLPGLRSFVIPVPHALVMPTPRVPDGGLEEAVLSSSTLYVLSSAEELWRGTVTFPRQSRQ